MPKRVKMVCIPCKALYKCFALPTFLVPVDEFKPQGRSEYTVEVENQLYV